MRYFLIIILLFCTSRTFSQSKFGVVKNEFRKIYYIEINGGAILPTMNERDGTIPSYLSNMLLSNHLGVAFRTQFQQKTSISAQLSYNHTGININKSELYRFSTAYATLFTPIDFEYKLNSFSTDASSLMLLYIGPYVAYNISGSLKDSIINLELNSGEIRKIDYGAEAGMGIRIPIFSANSRMNISFRCSYFYGFRKILNFDDLQNQHEAFVAATNGFLRNSGLRLSFSVEMCLNKWFLTTFTAGAKNKTTYERFVVIKNKNLVKFKPKDPFRFDKKKQEKPKD